MLFMLGKRMRSEFSSRRGKSMILRGAVAVQTVKTFVVSTFGG